MTALRGPHVGVGIVVERDGRVLLGLRHGSHGAETWGFPGGKVDPGEHPADTARRELAEETGLVAGRVEMLTWTNDVMPEAGLHFVTLHFLAPEATGEPQVFEPDRVGEWRWFAPDALPAPLFGPTAALVAAGLWGRPPSR